jgi:hypothetical protein
VLDSLKGYNDVHRVIGKRYLFGWARSRIKPIPLASVKASVLGDIHPDHVSCACLLQGRGPVSLAAGNIQYALSYDKAGCEGVAVDVLPEGKPIRGLGYHSLAIVIIKYERFY